MSTTTFAAFGKSAERQSWMLDELDRQRSLENGKLLHWLTRLEAETGITFQVVEFDRHPEPASRCGPKQNIDAHVTEALEACQLHPQTPCTRRVGDRTILVTAISTHLALWAEIDTTQPLTNLQVQGTGKSTQSAGLEESSSSRFGRQHLFRLSVQLLAAEEQLGMQRIEIDDFTAHLGMIYEQVHATTQLASQLRVVVTEDHSLSTVLNTVKTALDAQGVAFLWSESLERQRPSPDWVVPLQRRLQQATGEVVFLSETPDRTVIAALLHVERQPCWLLARLLPERHAGTEEGQFLLTVARMLETQLLNRRLFLEQDQMLISFIRSLISTLDARDHYTQGHSLRVAEVAAKLAELMELSTPEIDAVFVSGLLHDIGKIGISDAVLKKEGSLTAEEWEEIRRHPEVGHDILSAVRQLHHILPGVRNHHEALDGSGYPDGLRGEDIPLMARILAVADAFDAMVSDRPYRTGIPLQRVREILSEGAGKQWDASIVDLFLEHWESILERWQHATVGHQLHIATTSLSKV